MGECGRLFVCACACVSQSVSDGGDDGDRDSIPTERTSVFSQCEHDLMDTRRCVQMRERERERETEREWTVGMHATEVLVEYWDQFGFLLIHTRW
jgi:hypothetical protein